MPSLFCQKCHYSCNDCLVDGMTCSTSCPVNSSRIFNNGTCICANAYFDAGVSICQACDYTCTTCIDRSTKCTSCHSTRDYNNVTNTCLCKNKMFDTENNSEICQSCHYSCKSCISSSTSCVSCNASAHRILVISSCLCQSGF